MKDDWKNITIRKVLKQALQMTQNYYDISNLDEVIKEVIFNENEEMKNKVIEFYNMLIR